MLNDLIILVFTILFLLGLFIIGLCIFLGAFLYYCIEDIIEKYRSKN